MTRPDNTGFAPRGQRTPRGEQPRHTIEADDPNLRADAKQPMIPSAEIPEEKRLETLLWNRLSCNCLILFALIHVLRKHGGVQTDEDYTEAINGEAFTLGSKHLPYMFRHSRLPTAESRRHMQKDSSDAPFRSPAIERDPA